MIAGAVLLYIAVLGAAYSLLVWRAAPERRENRLFALLGLVGVLMVGWRGVLVMCGVPVIHPAAMMPCAVGSVLLALLSAEFLWMFPDGATMPRWLRAALSLVSASTVAVLASGEPGSLAGRWLGWLYFTPITITIVLIAVRAWRRSERPGVRLIVSAFIFRWLFGYVAYSAGSRSAHFEELIWIESTAAVLVGFVVIGHAILREQLFSVRGALAQIMAGTIFALLVIGDTAAAVWAVLRWIPLGSAQHVALVVTAFVPLVLMALGRLLYPRIETRVLAGLDERRAARLEALAEPLPDDADAALADGRARLERMTCSGQVRWLHELPPVLAERLGATREPDLLAGEQLPGELAAALATIDADLVVAGRLGHRVVGAWALRGGTIDRDTLAVARALAGQVGLALDRRRVLGELEEARRLAALGQFAAAIAHDIRTPLQSVTTSVQILRRKVSLPADDMEYFEIALEELGRLERSVAEILDYAKPVRIEPANIDVRELVDDAARGLAAVLEGKGLRLACEHERTLPAVLGDPQRLRQILVNLVDNAAGASPPGAAVTLRTHREPDRVVIDVEDRGRGITADELPRIFEPFFTTRPDGTGLGLAICQKLVRAHGGELRVRSAPGQGSTFSVVLPAT